MQSEIIKAIREELGLTQMQFAMKCGVTPATVYAWERENRDKGHNISINVLPRVLEIAPEDLRKQLLESLGI